MIADDTTCPHCDAEPTQRTCRGCGAAALITDCGHQDQPRPIAGNGIYGQDCSCDECEQQAEDDVSAVQDWARQQAALAAEGDTPLAESSVAEWVESAGEAGDHELLDTVERVGLDEAEVIYAAEVERIEDEEAAE